VRSYVATLTAIALLWLGSTVAHADTSELNDLATHMVGAPTTVECFETGQWYAGFVVMVSRDDGETWRNEDGVIHLDGADCGALRNVLTPTKRTVRWMRSYDGGATVGQALMHLAHEATHISLQSDDEGLVECTAYRNLLQYVKLLPLSWKERQAVYEGAKYNHFAKPTTGPGAEYRSAC
jgi:hypothetical protein